MSEFKLQGSSVISSMSKRIIFAFALHTKCHIIVVDVEMSVIQQFLCPCNIVRLECS